jgi:conjugative transfer signal peptidase TraF
MRIVRRFPIALTAGLVVIAAGAKNAHHSGWLINLTASAPIGLYRVDAPSAAVIARGMFVEFCPPAWVTPAAFPFYMRGDCSCGGMSMLKMIVGVPGDHISVKGDGIEINQVPLAGSAPRSRSISLPDTELPYLRGEFVLRPGEYWVYGSGARSTDSARSFDSRYFGAITITQIRAVAMR